MEETLRATASHDKTDAPHALGLGKTSKHVIDAFIDQCHIRAVKTSKLATSEAQQKSSGMKLVEKHRPRMSRLTDAERQKLMARGLRIIYGNSSAAKATHRG